MGTAINEDQLRYLKKFTRRIVLALDADTAGEKATLRGVEVARQALAGKLN
jgi:DNA primase